MATNMRWTKSSRNKPPVFSLESINCYAGAIATHMSVSLDCIYVKGDFYSMYIVPQHTQLLNIV